MRTILRLLTLFLISISAATAQEPAPEAATGRSNKPIVTAARHMIVAAHPLAAEAGDAMLDTGGSAIDAAIAAQLVLTLVEPQSSGIGGGGFMLHWEAATGDLDAYDGRETAPQSARPDRFLDSDRAPLPFFEAAIGGASVGVPGLMRMLELAHRRHGRLPWHTLFEPAVRLAENGFPISPRLHALLAADPFLPRNEAARTYFYRPDGTAKPVGAVLRNPELAASLRLLAAQGADALYSGPLAAAIVAAVRTAIPRAGDMSAADLAAYRAQERGPMCLPYRQQWRVCGMPPPSAGGLAVLQIMGILENFELSSLAPMSPDAAHLMAEAGKLAFADRDRYVADPEYVPVPVGPLLDSAYLRGRADIIRPTRAMEKAVPGEAPRKHGWADSASPETSSTTHVSVVDASGNAVALTSSVENAFGARLMVAGFLLNNQLTDFSFVPERDGRPVANSVAPGKRPRSAMAPTMVFDSAGRLRLVAGSPGGSRIIGYVAHTLVAILDWGMSLDKAVALPHVLNRNGPTELEAETQAAELAGPLAALGHRVGVYDMTSGLHVIAIDDDGWLHGGADPRREGIAVGD